MEKNTAKLSAWATDDAFRSVTDNLRKKSGVKVSPASETMLRFGKKLTLITATGVCGPEGNVCQGEVFESAIYRYSGCENPDEYISRCSACAPGEKK